MTGVIQNLRIGTKLAIASALSILLVAGMIYLQITGGANVREATEAAERQQAVAQNAAETKASVRGMTLGTRDSLLALNPSDLEKALEYFAQRKASTLKFADELKKLSKSAENHERIARLETLTDAL